jgi:hypothetical protein
MSPSGRFGTHKSAQVQSPDSPAHGRAQKPTAGDVDDAQNGAGDGKADTLISK